MRVQPRGMVERKKEYRGRNRERGERGGGGETKAGRKKKKVAQHQKPVSKRGGYGNIKNPPQ